MKNPFKSVITLLSVFFLLSCNTSGIYQNNSEKILEKRIVKTGNLNLKIHLPEDMIMKYPGMSTKALIDNGSSVVNSLTSSPQSNTTTGTVIKDLNFIVENTSFGGQYLQQKTVNPVSTNANASFTNIPEGNVKVFIEATDQNNTFLGSNNTDSESGKTIEIKANQPNSANIDLNIFDPNRSFYDFTIPTVQEGKIVIDGKTDDWSGISSALLDPEGDSQILNGNTIDLKEIFLAKDAHYLYCRGDVWKPFDFDSHSMDAGYTLSFKKTEQGNQEGDFEVRYYESKNQVRLDRIINGQHVGFNDSLPAVSDAQGISGHSFEIKIPLSELGNIDGIYLMFNYYCCQNQAFDVMKNLRLHTK